MHHLPLFGQHAEIVYDLSVELSTAMGTCIRNKAFVVAKENRQLLSTLLTDRETRWAIINGSKAWALSRPEGSQIASFKITGS